MKFLLVIRADGKWSQCRFRKNLKRGKETPARCYFAEEPFRFFDGWDILKAARYLHEHKYSHKWSKL